jgi:hypothetical protein
LLTATGCLAQESAPPAAAPVITVPAGTRVPLRLTSPLATKTAQTGDAVHAEVAFPVTASNTVAIPPGTYVEGTVDQVTRHGSHAGFTMHFTRMVFNNGYTVALPAANADTRAGLLRTADPQAAASAGPDVPVDAMALQGTTPTPAPLPSVGPSKGLVIGLAAAGAVAATVVAVIFGRRAGDRYLRAGYRLEMVLADSLSLDAAKVAAAVANPTP